MSSLDMTYNDVSNIDVSNNICKKKSRVNKQSNSRNVSNTKITAEVFNGIENINIVKVINHINNSSVCTETIKNDLCSLTIPMLKIVCRYYNLKLVGNKSDLIERIIEVYSEKLKIKIKDTQPSVEFLQYKIKRALAAKWFTLHGPAISNRSICVNDMDIMGQDLTDIPMDQFYSFTDQGFTYGFDIATFESIKKQDTDRYGRKVSPINPYTRDILPDEVLNDYESLLTYSKLHKREYFLTHENETNISTNRQTDAHGGQNNNTTTTTINVIVNETVNVEVFDIPEDVIDYGIRSLFYTIDTYGHYTNPDWVLNMTASRLKMFINDMIDIFRYRANLTPIVRMRIVHPTGILVEQSLSWLRASNNTALIKNKALEIMNKLVLSGITQEDRALGTFYVLTALTMNSTEAAQAMPWFYEVAI